MKIKEPIIIIVYFLSAFIIIMWGNTLPKMILMSVAISFGITGGYVIIWLIKAVRNIKKDWKEMKEAIQVLRGK